MLRLIDPPAVLPVSLAEVKALARLQDDDDAVVAGLVRAAVEWVEQRLGRALITSTWRYSPPHFLWLRCTTAIRIPIAPVQAVTEIRYLDPTSAEQVLNPAVYLVTGLPEAARISWAPGRSWPTMAHHPEALAIDITAGYGDWNSVPEPIRAGIAEAVRSMYDGCGMGHAEEILQPYRVWLF